MNQSGAFKIILVVTALGALTRLCAVWYTAAAPQSGLGLPDEIQYWEMAKSLADGSGLRDELGLRATRMPLYPAFLSWFVNLRQGRLWALAVQALAGALTCGFTSLLALHVAPQKSRAAIALIAGLLPAFDPYLVYFSGLLLTESPFTSALCAFMAISWPTCQPGRSCGILRWLCSGITCCLCIYLRPAALGLLAVWSVFVVIGRRGERSAILGLCVQWLVLLIALSPWAARNRSLIGQWAWLTTNMGISLYDGVHPLADGSSDQAAIKHIELPEVDRDSHFIAESWKCIRTGPMRLVRLAAVKLLRTWNLWPNAEGYQSLSIKWVTGMWTVFVLGSALAGAMALRKEAFSLLGLLLPALYFTALHMVFVGSIRYRLPAMPMIEVLSAIGVVFLLSRLRDCLRQPESRWAPR